MAKMNIESLYRSVDYTPSADSSSEEFVPDVYAVASAMNVPIFAAQILVELYGFADRLIAWYDSLGDSLAHYNVAACRCAHLARGAIANLDLRKLRELHGDMCGRRLHMKRQLPMVRGALNLNPAAELATIDEIKILRFLTNFLSEVPVTEEQPEFERGCYCY